MAARFAYQLNRPKTRNRSDDFNILPASWTGSPNRYFNGSETIGEQNPQADRSKVIGYTGPRAQAQAEEAMAVVDTIVALNDGRIEDIGDPERIYLRPASRFSARFMGDSNLLEGAVVRLTRRRDAATRRSPRNWSRHGRVC